MQNRFVILLILIGITLSTRAQELYQNSAGIRVGHTSGLTYKKFFEDDEAIEVMMSGRRGMQITLSYQTYLPLEFSFNEGFYAYYGWGGHVGVERYNRLNKVLIQEDPPEFAFERKSYYTMGIDAYLGVEYRWLSVPMTISFDVKPYFNYIGMRYGRAKFWDSALSFKYVF